MKLSNMRHCDFVKDAKGRIHMFIALNDGKSAQGGPEHCLLRRLDDKAQIAVYGNQAKQFTPCDEDGNDLEFADGSEA